MSNWTDPWYLTDKMKAHIPALEHHQIMALAAPRPFLALGWLVYAGVYVAFAFATTAWQAWALFLAYALFYGLTEPSEKTLVANLAGAERKGLAYGWYNFAVGVATLPASLIFGGLYQYFGAVAAFGWGAALALAAVVLLAGVRSHDSP